MIGETWSWEEDKAFENALAIHHETCSDWWEKIAAAVPGKSMEEIKKHYEILVEEVRNIESGRVPLPNYASPSSAAEDSGDGGGNGKKGGHSYCDSIHSGKSSRLDHERRKGIAWTEEEHRLFLLGLDKYGKGDWRSISRNFVISRTPTQVASHAQKYFIRLNSMNKDRRRSSIHDITSVSNGDLSPSQAPITGQVNNLSSPTTTKAIKQPYHATASAPGIAIYGSSSAIGRPLGVPLMPAVGTPVAGPPMAYGIRPPHVPGVVVAAADSRVHLAPHPMHKSSSSRR
uniref:Transcription factor MYBS1 n=1 Tax=Cymbidium sinense TaxID=112615 RepID=A0A455LAD6_9ASPA|nr:transcription factor SRM1-like protein [Cymbidium sinense]